LAGFLLINPRSGKGRPSVDELAAAARERGIEVRVLREGDDPGELAGEAGADALGIAGGDGSLAAVAQVAIEHELWFVCVPFGTRNHFARDLGLDRADPLAALAAFGGEERRIDVGRVGERLFLNNVSAPTPRSSTAARRTVAGATRWREFERCFRRQPTRIHSGCGSMASRSRHASC
jgi:diacylglycerol kinase family enzyme